MKHRNRLLLSTPKKLDQNRVFAMLSRQYFIITTIALEAISCCVVDHARQGLSPLGSRLIATLGLSPKLQADEGQSGVFLHIR